MHPGFRRWHPPGPLALAATFLLGAPPALVSEPLPAIDYTDYFQWKAAYGFGGHYVWPVSLDGNLLYLAAGASGDTRLRVLDVSDPKRPRIVLNHFLSESPSGVLAKGDRVYVTRTGVLRVLEWESGRLVERGQVSGMPGYPRIAPHGAILAAANSYGLVIVDVEEASNPTVLATVDLPARAASLHFHGSELLVLSDTSVLYYDLTVPSAPELERILELSVADPTSYGWTVAGDYGYRTDGDVVSVFDLSMTGVTEPVSEVTLLDWSSSVTLQGSTLWAPSSTRLQAIDVSDPGNLRITGDSHIGGVAVLTANDRLYLVAGYPGVVALDNTPLPNPEIPGNWEGPEVRDLVLEGTDLIFIAGENIWVLDASDPLDLQVRSIEYLQFQSRSVGEADGLACATTQLTMEIVDVSDPTEIHKVSRVVGDFSEVVVGGNHAFVTHPEGGLTIFRLGDGTSPEAVRELPEITAGSSLALSGGHLFAVTSGGLLVFDVGDPGAPELRGRLDWSEPHPGASADLAVEGHRLAATFEDGSVLLVDVSDPAHPDPVDRFTLGPYLRSVALDGTDLYLTSWFAGVFVLDWSLLNQPGEWANFHRIMTGEAIAPVGGAVLVVDHGGTGSGIRVLPRHQFAAAPATAVAPGPETGRPRLLRVSGNPARRGGSWILSVERRSKVHGVVFDVTGRRVAELIDRPLPVGAHRLEWDGRTLDGRHVAAGVYFVNVRSDDFTLTDEIVLIR